MAQTYQINSKSVSSFSGFPALSYFECIAGQSESFRFMSCLYLRGFRRQKIRDEKVIESPLYFKEKSYIRESSWLFNSLFEIIG